MKNLQKYLSIIFTIIAVITKAQTVSLDDCYLKSDSTFSYNKQKQLNSDISEQEVQNAKTSNLPSLNLSGQATYQSEVFGLPITLPNIQIDEIPKFQYKAGINLQQTIFDGNLSKKNSEISIAKMNLQNANIDVEKYQNRLKINAIYFGILLSDLQLEILENNIVLIDEQLETLKSQVQNGITLESNYLIIEKQKFSIEQGIIQAKTNKAALVKMLGKWTSENYTESTKLEQPEIENTSLLKSNNRPEFTLFEAQKSMFDSQSNLLNIKRLPKLSLFGTLGAGQPNPLNVFETDLKPYYIAGIQIQWKIWDWKKTAREKNIIEIQKQLTDTKMEMFQKSLDIQEQKYLTEQQKFDKLVQKDDEILKIQNKILKQLKSQLENGTITATIYTKELTEKINAELQKETHKIQKIRNYIDWKTWKGLAK